MGAWVRTEEGQGVRTAGARNLPLSYLDRILSSSSCCVAGANCFSASTYFGTGTVPVLSLGYFSDAPLPVASPSDMLVEQRGAMPLCLCWWSGASAVLVTS